MGVATGVFQYANNSPVANGSYQWKLSSDAIQFSMTSACTVPTIINGNLDGNGNLTTTFAFNDVLSTTAGAVTTYQLTVKAQGGGQVWNENYYLTGSAANLNLIPPSGGAPFFTVTASTTTLPAAYTGDGLRFNVNNDNAWDAVNFAQPLSWIIPTAGQVPGSNGTVGGPLSIAYGSLSGSGHFTINPISASLGVGDQWTSANGSATTSTVIGEVMGNNGNNSVLGMLNFYRWSLKFKAVTSASYRYWMGLAAYSNGGGGGNNNQTPLGNSRYAADSPNATTIGFRFSAGTDVHWQAVSAIGGGSQTTADTGVSIDTNAHLFEFMLNYSATALTFLIDLVPVATITTNIPNLTSGANSFMDYFWTGDNKNVANTITAVTYGFLLSHRIV